MNITQLLQDYLAAEKMLADLGEKIGKHFVKNDGGSIMTKLAPAKAPKKKKSTVSDPGSIRQRANDAGITVMTFGEWCDRNGYAKPLFSEGNNYTKLYSRYQTYKKNLIGGKSSDATPPPPKWWWKRMTVLITTFRIFSDAERVRQDADLSRQARQRIAPAW